MRSESLRRAAAAAVALGLLLGALAGWLLPAKRAEAAPIHPRLAEYIAGQAVLEGACGPNQSCEVGSLTIRNSSAGNLLTFNTGATTTFRGICFESTCTAGRIYYTPSTVSMTINAAITSLSGELQMTNTFTNLSTIVSTRAAGNNAIQFNNSGARMDLGTGTNDYVSSDGTYGGAAGGWRINRANAAKPSCDSSARGLIYYVEGGAGVADTWEVCRKDAADAYAWVSVY